MRFTRSSRISLTAGLLALGSSTLAQSTTLGVVYLNSNTPNPDAAWISRGLADMLTTDLSKIGRLTVVQREQLDKVLKEQALGASGAVDPGKAAQLGKVLGVQTLLTGSYAAIGRNVRVDLQLVNTSTGRVEGGVTAEGSIDSIFTLEKQLVLAVLNKLGITPSPAEMQTILQPETLNNQAVILNYQALSLLQKDPKAAAAALQQAVTLDPTYASAQQNLRTALSLSGSSIANAALLDLDLKSKEIEAVRQVAELIKAGVRIVDVKLEDPTTSAGQPGTVKIPYTLKVRLAPGTLMAVARVLEPFSREGSNRATLTLEAPGIGRGDVKVISLAKESLFFLRDYLGSFSVWHAFYGTGKHPVYVNSLRHPNSDLTVASVVGIHGYGAQNLSEVGAAALSYDLDMPVSLAKNLLTSSAVVANENEYNFIPGANFIYIDARNARELGVPEGYLRDVSMDAERECTVSLKTGKFKIDFEKISSIDDILGLSGSCLIYTKINDGDFNPKSLQSLLEAGEDFKVSSYQLDTKSVIVRDRRDLVRMVELVFDYKEYGIKFNLMSPSVYVGYSQYYSFSPLSFDGRPSKLVGFTVKPFF
ncbi:CsgG/HfaB family protein [Deinococcus sp. MIMF12]|uniref:CsgG/HfaB family protein n=1 Tax=Deinococcus rhizophilus TaxID=3049544 RepID=A0ABT7JIH7_9DEIO|nr:CsgG/HfaB family protein [Deinococcus rhizophilus]MDL2343459.1 CsgG/HfaB family protein [Deinococcus rhizophilus]